MVLTTALAGQAQRKFLLKWPATPENSSRGNADVSCQKLSLVSVDPRLRGYDAALHAWQEGSESDPH